MSCGTLLRTRVRFSPPPPAGRSAGWLAREGETVEHQLEGGIVAARGLFDLVGVGLVLEHDDHRATGGAPRRDRHPLPGGGAAPRLAPPVAVGGGALYLFPLAQPDPPPPPPARHKPHPAAGRG